MAKGWTPAQLGDLHGRTALVTGANSGIGLYTALELGRAGGQVTIACRDPGRGEAALAQLRAEAPAATFRLERLDLADLASVRGLAERMLAAGAPLDLLVNNAGLMALPTRELTADGFERQLGTNHLGHFALTGLLLPALRKSKAPRVVSVSSGMARFGKIALDDLQSERRYAPMSVYSQSKLANLLFMFELGRRAPWLVSVAAHPGAAQTGLQKHAFKNTVWLFGQSAADGALPTLRATVEACLSGTYFGPRWFGLRGAPVVVRVPGQARDERVAHELWAASEQLTGVRFASG